MSKDGLERIIESLTKENEIQHNMVEILRKDLMVARFEITSNEKERNQLKHEHGQLRTELARLFVKPNNFDHQGIFDTQEGIMVNVGYNVSNGEVCDITNLDNVEDKKFQYVSEIIDFCNEHYDDVKDFAIIDRAVESLEAE